MLYASLPYDPETDFTPISLISDVPLVFIVNPKSPVGDLKGLVALAKQKREALTIGHPGIGTGGASDGDLVCQPRRDQRHSRGLSRRRCRSSRRCSAARSTRGIPAYIPQVHSAKSIAVTSGNGSISCPASDGARERRRRRGLGHLHSTRRAGRHAAGDRHENEPGPRCVPQDRGGEKAVRDARRPTLGGPPERLTERMNQEKALWGPIVKSADIRLQ